MYIYMKTQGNQEAESMKLTEHMKRRKSIRTALCKNRREIVSQ